jgi:hypothetical protein
MTITTSDRETIPSDPRPMRPGRTRRAARMVCYVVAPGATRAAVAR